MDSGRRQLETVPNGTGHLDTVRALHQTVVSLRTALEISKNELKELKEKYQQHSDCIQYADVIEKLSLENHILRRKIIDSGFEDRDVKTPNIKLKVTYSPTQNVEEYSGSEVIIKSATTDVTSYLETFEPDPDKIKEALEEDDSKVEELEDKEESFCSTDKLNNIVEDQPQYPEVDITAEFSPNNLNTHRREVEDSNSQIISFSDKEDNHPASFKTKLELLSKFDVRIKVRTIKEGTILSSTTSDSESIDNQKDANDIEKESSESNKSFYFEEKREHFDTSEDKRGNIVNFRTVSEENIKMAVPNEAEAKSKVDKFDVQVRITSEENLVVKENVERSRRKDTLNLDVDDLSLRSMSEGDNSVFSETVTPVEPRDPVIEDKDQGTGSGNESEEVDDIELIFTTDESKDMSNLQEDLVSIREGDHWGPSSASTHSTPVLIKFHTLDPDFQPGGERDNFQNENQENSDLQGVVPDLKKRVSLPNDKEIRQVSFHGKSLDLPGKGILKSCDNRSDNMLYKKSPNTSTRRLDSVDSLTCEYNRALSFDTYNTKSSSFELGSSMDILQREESMDSFRASHFGHRFSVFAETDISKCGISEDDLASNLNVRRNTCPNPFQYRPGYRGVSRPPGPFKATAGLNTTGVRPVIRAGGGVRRESGAQTDVSALPPRWSSDGHLAYKMAIPPMSVMPTLPQRAAVTTSRRLTVPDARPPPLVRRSDDTRRVLLSDIGFTSMVPELSRSADPVWALGRRGNSVESDQLSTSTSKFLSRGSSYRSGGASMDRSGDWTQHVYAPTKDYRPWRSSLPDVRGDDTDELIQEAETYLRRSIDNLRSTSLDLDQPAVQTGQPYIPSEPRQLRLGHTVKLITPQGRIAVGRVRYVGIAGGSAATSAVVVGVECPLLGVGAPRNDGTYRGRRYFLAPPNMTALFVPFRKVVMAWVN